MASKVFICFIVLMCCLILSAKKKEKSLIIVLSNSGGCGGGNVVFKQGKDKKGGGHEIILTGGGGGGEGSDCGCSHTCNSCGGHVDQPVHFSQPVPMDLPSQHFSGEEKPSESQAYPSIMHLNQKKKEEEKHEYGNQDKEISESNHMVAPLFVPLSARVSELLPGSPVFVDQTNEAFGDLKEHITDQSSSNSLPYTIDSALMSQIDPNILKVFDTINHQNQVLNESKEKNLLANKDKQSVKKKNNSTTFFSNIINAINKLKSRRTPSKTTQKPIAQPSTIQQLFAPTLMPFLISNAANSKNQQNMHHVNLASYPPNFINFGQSLGPTILPYTLINSQQNVQNQNSALNNLENISKNVKEKNIKANNINENNGLFGSSDNKIEGQVVNLLLGEVRPVFAPLTDINAAESQVNEKFLHKPDNMKVTKVSKPSTNDNRVFRPLLVSVQRLFNSSTGLKLPSIESLIPNRMKTSSTHLMPKWYNNTSFSPLIEPSFKPYLLKASKEKLIKTTLKPKDRKYLHLIRDHVKANGKSIHQVSILNTLLRPLRRNRNQIKNINSLNNFHNNANNIKKNNDINRGKTTPRLLPFLKAIEKGGLNPSAVSQHAILNQALLDPLIFKLNPNLLPIEAQVNNFMKDEKVNPNNLNQNTPLEIPFSSFNQANTLFYPMLPGNLIDTLDINRPIVDQNNNKNNIKNNNNNSNNTSDSFSINRINNNNVNHNMNINNINNINNNDQSIIKQLVETKWQRWPIESVVGPNLNSYQLDHIA